MSEHRAKRAADLRWNLRRRLGIEPDHRKLRQNELARLHERLDTLEEESNANDDT